jgi:hypothetical protein
LRQPALRQVILDLEHIDVIDPQALHEIIDLENRSRALSLFRLLGSLLPLRKPFQSLQQPQHLLHINHIPTAQPTLVLFEIPFQLALRLHDH